MSNEEIGAQSLLINLDSKVMNTVNATTYGTAYINNILSW